MLRRSLFVVSLQYKVGLDEVNKHLESHRAFLEKCYQQKIFIVSGRKVPRTGGIIIASARNQAALESILESDPFKQHGIADYQITEFVPTMCDFDLSDLVKRYTENKKRNES